MAREHELPSFGDPDSVTKSRVPPSLLPPPPENCSFLTRGKLARRMCGAERVYPFSGKNPCGTNSSGIIPVRINAYCIANSRTKITNRTDSFRTSGHGEVASGRNPILALKAPLPLATR